MFFVENNKIINQIYNGSSWFLKDFLRICTAFFFRLNKKFKYFSVHLNFITTFVYEIMQFRIFLYSLPK